MRVFRSAAECGAVLVFNIKEILMPRGDKSSYSDKQKRQAEHIEKSSKKRGYGRKRAEQIAWATVNKRDGGAKGKKSGGKSKRSHAR
jgi:hypothetical protein